MSSPLRMIVLTPLHQKQPTTQLGHHQRGVALLTILLMVVIASIMAMTILNQQQRMIRESSILLRQDQAWAYAKSGELFLSELLVDDSKNSNKTDNLTERWAQPLPVFPVEDGSVAGRLIDESGKFNINSLNAKPEQPPENNVAYNYFKRLLKRLEISPDLADAVVDWQDADSEVYGSAGAEDSFYTGQQPAYLAANRAFNSIDELKQVRGFDPEIYLKLKPYITALPNTGASASVINVNTASAVVLAALDDSLTVEAVQQWIDTRDKEKAFLEQINDLWTQPPFSQIRDEQAQGLISPLLGVKSDYFKAEIVVTLSERKRYLNSKLFRVGERVMVYQRSMAPVAAIESGDVLQQLLQQFSAKKP
jgi:general secretion pathway protein K